LVASAKSPRSGALITVVSVMILVGAEVFGVAIAAAWAIAGLFELGEIAGYALGVLFSLAGAYVLMLLWRRAHAVERRGGLQP
jgi:hypothetical protein